MATIAPFSVAIVGKQHCWGQAVHYEIEITDAVANRHVVHWCYSSFVDLAKALHVRCPELPELPPKSVLRKRLSSSFRSERQTALAAFLNSALASEAAFEIRFLWMFLNIPIRKNNDPVVGVVFDGCRTGKVLVDVPHLNPGKLHTKLYTIMESDESNLAMDCEQYN